MVCSPESFMPVQTRSRLWSPSMSLARIEKVVSFVLSVSPSQARIQAFFWSTYRATTIDREPSVRTVRLSDREDLFFARFLVGVEARHVEYHFVREGGYVVDGQLGLGGGESIGARRGLRFRLDLASGDGTSRRGRSRTTLNQEIYGRHECESAREKEKLLGLSASSHRSGDAL